MAEINKANDGQGENLATQQAGEVEHNLERDHPHLAHTRLGEDLAIPTTKTDLAVEEAGVERRHGKNKMDTGLKE